MEPPEIRDVVVVIDEDAAEALYIDGEIVGGIDYTVYAYDLAEAVGESIIKFSHIEVTREDGASWPQKLADLKRL